MTHGYAAVHLPYLAQLTPQGQRNMYRNAENGTEISYVVL